MPSKPWRVCIRQQGRNVADPERGNPEKGRAIESSLPPNRLLDPCQMCGDAVADRMDGSGPSGEKCKANLVAPALETYCYQVRDLHEAAGSEVEVGSEHRC